MIVIWLGMWAGWSGRFVSVTFLPSFFVCFFFLVWFGFLVTQFHRPARSLIFFFVLPSFFPWPTNVFAFHFPSNIQLTISWNHWSKKKTECEISDLTI